MKKEEHIEEKQESIGGLFYKRRSIKNSRRKEEAHLAEHNKNPQQKRRELKMKETRRIKIKEREPVEEKNIEEEPIKAKKKDTYSIYSKKKQKEAQ